MGFFYLNLGMVVVLNKDTDIQKLEKVLAERKPQKKEIIVQLAFPSYRPLPLAPFLFFEAKRSCLLWQPYSNLRKLF